MAKVERTARRQFVSQVRTRAIGVDTGRGDERLAILTELSKFAQAGSAEANRQQKAEIETKKALGASRAAQDMLKAEQHRQGVTEDDVLATKLSYNAIAGKHDTMTAGNDFMEWYQANPAATDEEIESKKTELYQPLFEKYGGDERSLQQISLDVQQSQFQMLSAQEAVKVNYTKKKNQEALGMSISDLMSTPDADMDAILDVELPARAKSLGLGEFDMKSAVMKDAAIRAAEGDKRLLEKLERTPWAKDSALLKKARTDYDRFEAREQAPVIGDAMADIEIEMNSLTVPWSTTLRKIESLNKQHPNTYSAARVAQLKQQRANSEAKATKMTTGTQSSFAIYTDDKAVPLAHNPEYTDSDKKAIIKDLETQWANKVTELTDAGFGDDEARQTVLRDQLKWSRLNRTVIPSLKTNLDSAVNLPLDEIQAAEELPAFATGSFQLIRTMDATAIELYLPSKQDSAFALNFKKFSQTMSDDAAYRRAALIKRNPFKVSPAQREEQRGAVHRIVEDKLDTNIWDDINPFSTKEAVPEWQRNQLINRISDDAEQFMFAGGFDAESNAEQALQARMANSFQLFNGTMANKSMPLIGQHIASGRPMDVNKTGDYIEAYTLSMKPLIAKAYGTDVDTNDITLDFSRDGSSFIIIDKNGEQLGGRHLTDEMYNVGRDADLKRLRELNVSEETQREREEEFKRAIEFDIERGFLPAIPQA